LRRGVTGIFREAETELSGQVNDADRTGTDPSCLRVNQSACAGLGGDTRRGIDKIPMDNLEITPAEVKQRLDQGEKLLLIDVREPWEFNICSIEGAKLIPMGTVPANLQALDTDDDIVVYCHRGMRSLDVAVWLRGQGVERAKSLAGGIERWSLEIDPKVSRY
jgi:rhodanese-related sulfurtransferase